MIVIDANSVEALKTLFQQCPKCESGRIDLAPLVMLCAQDSLLWYFAVAL